MAADRYREIVAAHRWNVPAEFNIGQACCARWANDRSRFALYWEDESGTSLAYTFWDLQQRANRLSNALAALGVGRDDKVALILPQRPETVVAHMATYQLGAVTVPLSFLFGPEALEYRLNDSDARIVFVDPQSEPNLAPIRDRCPDHPCRRVAGSSGPDHTLRGAARAGIVSLRRRLDALGRSGAPRLHERHDRAA
jgi:acetyl-CoA synthetase